jgi:hypothetical protein
MLGSSVVAAAAFGQNPDGAPDAQRRPAHGSAMQRPRLPEPHRPFPAKAVKEPTSHSSNDKTAQLPERLTGPPQRVR